MARVHDGGAQRAQARWVRVKGNQSTDQYEVLAAVVRKPDPIWPELSMRDLLEKAFGNGHYIDDADRLVI